jgi:hypothetical protein
MQLRKRTELSI